MAYSRESTAICGIFFFYSQHILCEEYFFLYVLNLLIFSQKMLAEVRGEQGSPSSETRSRAVFLRTHL